MKSLENLLELRTSLRRMLEHGLYTERGTAEARDEAKRVLRESQATCRCQACGGELLLHTKNNGYCRKCNARFDRMLCFKSRIKREMPKEGALRRFIDDYKQTEALPYALRGPATREEIVQYASDLLIVITEIKQYFKEATNDKDM